MTTPGFVNEPSETIVDTFEATIPELLRPTKAINPPRVKEMISWSFFGIASSNIFLIGVNEKTKKMIPAMVRRIIFCCQLVKPRLEPNVNAK